MRTTIFYSTLLLLLIVSLVGLGVLTAMLPYKLVAPWRSQGLVLFAPVVPAS